jgi:Ca2+-binding EF-hand superfamily protein
LFCDSFATQLGSSLVVALGDHSMRNNTKIALAFGVAALLSGTSLALAQMDGPSPPDGPMQGLVRRERLADRLSAEFDSNHDGKITHAEFNNVLGGRFAAGTHGAKQMSADQFLAIHQADFAKHTAEIFHRADWNGDGRLTLEEFSAPQRAHFEMMDSAGSGVVSCSPVVRANYQPGATGRSSSGRSGPGVGGRGFGGFGRARFCSEDDLSRDGRVTRAEFDTMTAKEFSAAAGGGATMSLAQFTADEAARYRDTNAKMFKRLDTNGDGRLSLAEFAEPPEKMFDRLDRNRDGMITPEEMKPRFSGRRSSSGRGGNRRSPSNDEN